MSLEVTKDFFRLLFNKVDADVGVEHIAHQNASRFCILGCLRSSIKSGLNLSRLSTKTSHEPLAGISTTTLPDFLMNTWSSLNLNSLGRRTAWLWPFRNNFAVFMCHLHTVYTYKYILYYALVQEKSPAMLPAPHSSLPISSLTHPQTPDTPFLFLPLEQMVHNRN